jgi:hypothetical protein
MSDLTDFQTDIRNWTARPDLDDARVLSFIRMAETSIDLTLRVREAIEVVTGPIDSDRRVTLPVDFNSMDYLRPVDGVPLRFEVKDNFFSIDNTSGCYTIVGNQLRVGSSIAVDASVEMAYYKKVPQFIDASTWLHSYYYNIFLQSSLAAAYLYLQEYERSAALTEVINGWIESANMKSVSSQIAGPLKKRVPRRIG